VNASDVGHYQNGFTFFAAAPPTGATARQSMNRRFVITSHLFAFTALACAFTAQAATQNLRVLTHSSFALPKPLLAKFEADNQVKLNIVKAGDAGEMLNKLILTKAKPIADVVYGIDNALQAKAQAANVLDTYTGPAAQRSSAAKLDAPLVPVDYGYVTLNYDKASFAKSGVALPQSLDDLAKPAYKGMLVVQNPATSSPGNAFLLSTIASMGEAAAFDWWARMRANGMKVSQGWSDAYYKDFARNGGKYPIVVSYASSPAAEVFYSKTKLTEPPTGSLALKGAVFQQIEGIALVKGGKQAELGGKFIEFMRSPAVQEALQTEMWMFAAEPGTAKAEVMRHAPEPAAFDALSASEIAAKNSEWVNRWTKVVLK
jgi:thiamine transport system substrate-binding protein